jgi:tetratricopeptide (TPR) repeat protein
MKEARFQAEVRAAAALHAAGRTAEAAASLGRLLPVAPPQTDLLNEVGMFALQMGDLPLGIAWLGRSLVVDPRQPTVWAIRGVGLNRLQRPAEALSDLNRAIELQPSYADAYFDRACVYRALGRLEEARVDFEQAVEREPAHAPALSNLGAVLHELGRPQEALASCERAVAIDPNYAQGHYNRGVVLESEGRWEDALAGFERAIAIDPRHADAHWARAHHLLRRGDLAEGWRAYEWRWHGPQRGGQRHFAQPLWLGDASPAGKTIFVHAEQGLGDFIQFCRLVPTLAALGASVLLEVPAELATLAASLPDVACFVARGSAPPAFDWHCPLLSLPLALRLEEGSIPASVPYLEAPADRVRQWQEVLGPRRRPRVGLAWSGAAGHRNDRRRSIALEHLAPLLLEGIEFHSLQREVREADLPFLARSALLRHDEQLADFADTAALALQMDLVISVDTAIAHLCGALGKPLWILLPRNPDFRWMLDRSDSPWYPTATLLRDAGGGVSEDLALAAAARLREWL